MYQIKMVHRILRSVENNRYDDNMLIDAGILFARTLVGGVFLLAGLAKLKAPSSRFLNAILGYDLLAKPMATILARGLPWLEIVAGGLLLVGLWTRIVALLGTGLLLVFSSAVAISLLRGKDQACGCFHSLTPVQWQLVYRNVGLMGLLLPIYAFSGGRWAVDSWLTVQSNSPLWFSTGLVALVVAWLLILSATLLLQWLTRQNSVKSANLQQSQ
jgi:uncharacterized membrane protein YphA (DoxX/SURF4 family)